MSRILETVKTFFQGQRQLAATTQRGGSMKARKLVRGFWSPRALLPIQVSDPDKLLHVVSPFVNLQQVNINRLYRAKPTISDKLIRQATLSMFFAGARETLRELDRILFGGGVRWAIEYENLVVNEGLNHLLDVTLSGGTQDTSWFVGLLAASPSPLAAWTATEIASNDFVAYDEATLQAFTDGGVSSQSMSNSASPATFTCSTNSSSVGGAYLIGTNAKATPAGTLYAAGAFSGGNKALDDNDTLEVTATFTAADDGA